jgi:hypothetical protein
MIPAVFTYNPGIKLDYIVTPVSIKQNPRICKTFGLSCTSVDTQALWDTGASPSFYSMSLLGWIL